MRPSSLIKVRILLATRDQISGVKHLVGSEVDFAHHNSVLPIVQQLRGQNEPYTADEVLVIKLKWALDLCTS